MTPFNPDEFGHGMTVCSICLAGLSLVLDTLLKYLIIFKHIIDRCSLIKLTMLSDALIIEAVFLSELSLVRLYYNQSAIVTQMSVS